MLIYYVYKKYVWYTHIYVNDTNINVQIPNDNLIEIDPLQVSVIYQAGSYRPEIRRYMAGMLITM